MTYQQYMQQVDAELLKICGLTHSDLSDFCSRDLYEDGVSPREAAEECLEMSDFPMEMLS